MYIDHLIAQYEALDHPPTRGCTEEEIDALERELGLSLPAAYREFLGWAGHDAGDIFLDVDNTSYDYIREFQAQARMLVQAAELPEPIPDDAIIILDSDTFLFTFLRTSEGPDPCTYLVSVLPSHMTYTFENEQTSVTKTVIVPFDTPKTFIQGPPFSEWLAEHIRGLIDSDSEP